MDTKQEEHLIINKQTGKKIKEGNDENGLIVDENNQVIDIVDLINDSGDSAIAIRLATLFESGVSEEMVVQQYMNISSGVTDKNVAIESMRAVLDILIQYVSSIPNGIVIDPRTGEIDRIESLKEAVKCGILRPDDVILLERDENSVEFFKEDNFLSQIMKSEIISEDTKEDIFWNYNERIRYMATPYSRFDNEEIEEDDAKADELLIEEEIETKEEQEIANEKKEFYSLSNREEMDLMQKVIFFGKKDHHISQNQLEGYMKIYENCKFYSQIVDENGKLDINKIRAFAKEWMVEYNKLNLRDDLKRYNRFAKNEKVDFEQLDDVNKANLKSVLARGFLSEDKNNKKSFDKLCEKLGIGNDLESILKVTGCATIKQLEAIKKDNDINEKNYMKKISDMKRYKKMSQGEKMIFEVTEKLKLYQDTDKEAVARLYVMYSEKMNEFPNFSADRKAYGEVAKALEHFMLYNKEYFSEYMTFIKEGDSTIINKVDYARVKKVLDAKEAPKTRTNNLTRKISTEIDERLESLKGTDDKISRQEFDKFFDEKSEEIAVDYINERKQRNSKKTKKQEEQTENNPENDSGSDSESTSDSDSKKDEKSEIDETSSNSGTKGHLFTSLMIVVGKNIKRLFNKVKNTINRRRENKEKITQNEKKLLQEPKEEPKADEPKTKKNFVPEAQIDHAKAHRDTQTNKSMEPVQPNDREPI